MGDLKDIIILHKEFPRTLPEWRINEARSVKGDQWNESDHEFKGAEGSKEQSQSSRSQTRS